MSTTNWKTGSSGDWTSAANWDNGVPSSSTDATIGVGGNYTVSLIGTAGQALDLTVSDTGAIIDIAAAGGIGGDLDVVGTVSNGGVINIDDNNFSTGGSVFTVGTTLTNSGSLFIGANGITSQTTVSASALVNTGLIQIAGDNSGRAASVVDVEGPAGFGSAGVVTGQLELDGAALLDFASGVFTGIASGARLTITTGSAFVATGAAVTGNSALTGLSSNAGEFDLANGASVSVTGNFLNTSNTNIDRNNFSNGGSTFDVAGTLTNSGSLFVGANGITANSTVSAGGLVNIGLIQIAGDNSDRATAILDVGGAAGLGTTGVLTGQVELDGAALLDFASGGFTSIASGARLTITTISGFVATGRATTGNSALTGLSSNAGEFDLANGATVSVTGNFLNTSNTNIDRNNFSTGGSTFDVAGTLTNSASLFVGANGITTNTTVSAGGLVNTNTGSILIAGDNLDRATAVLDVGGPAGFGTTGVVTGQVELDGAALLDFATGGFTSIASGARLSLETSSGFVAIGSAVPGNSALTGLSSNAGEFDLAFGATVSVTGNFLNTSNTNIDRNDFSTGGSTFDVAGTLTNSASLFVGANGITANSTVSAGGLVNTSTGSILIAGDNLDRATAILDVAGAAGFGTTGIVTGQVELDGAALLDFATGGFTSIASGARLSLETSSGFVATGAATTSNSALTGLSSNAGEFDLAYGASVSVTGNFLNTSNTNIDRNDFSTGGSTFDVAGTLTNSASLFVGANGITANSTVSAGGLVNTSTGSILIAGDNLDRATAILDVAGAAGFGTTGVLTGQVELDGAALLDFATGGFTNIASGARLSLETSIGFVATGAATTSNSALTGLSSNAGEFDLAYGATVSVTGNFLNTSNTNIDRNDFSTGGSTFDVAGTLTNSASLFVGENGITANTTVSAGGLVNTSTGSILIAGDNSAHAQAILNVGGPAGFGSAGAVTGQVELDGAALLDFASGGFTSIASGARLSLETSIGFVATGAATTSNSALTGLSSNAGEFDLAYGASVSVTGNFLNTSNTNIDRNDFSTGGSTFDVAGTLTNSASLFVGENGITANTTVSAGGLVNTSTGSILIAGDNSAHATAILDVGGAAGFGTTGILTGQVELDGAALLDFATGGFTSIASGARLSLETSIGFVAIGAATTSNSALTGLSSNAGEFDLAYGASVSVTGNFLNTSNTNIDDNDFSTGGSTFDVAGTLTNSGNLFIGENGITANTTVSAGGLVNTGGIVIAGDNSNHGKAILNIGGAASDTGFIGLGSSALLSATSLAVQGGGSVSIGTGATAIGVVLTGGSEIVSSGGTVSAPVISSGIVNLQSGAVVGGGITFAGTGTLSIGGTVMPTNTISGFAPGDILDLTSLGWSSSSTAVLNGNTLTVTGTSGTVDQLILSSVHGGTTFSTASDGNTGTSVGLIASSAGATISGTYTNGLTLTNPAQNPATLTSTALVTTSVTGYGRALYAPSGPAWSITNDGTVIGNLAGSVTGIGLAVVGTVVNGAPGVTTALIAGGQSGIDAGPQPGPSLVVNFGTIESTGNNNGAGIHLAHGGTVVNGSTGSTAAVISAGGWGVYVGATNGTAFAGATGSVVNYGTIIGSRAVVELIEGGTVANFGTIAGNSANTHGIDVDATGVVINRGAIVTNGEGIYLFGGSVANSGVISTTGAGNVGIALGNGGGVVTNSGRIFGAGYGIELASGVTTVSNTGTIIGGTGVRAETIANYGTIGGTNGTAVVLTGTYGRLIVGLNSVLLGSAGSAGIVRGVQAGDVLDFRGIAGASATLGANNLLTVSGGGTSTTLQLDPTQNFTGDIFATAADGAGGTSVEVAAPAVLGTNLLVDPGAEAATAGASFDTVVPITGWTVNGNLTADSYAQAGGDLGSAQSSAISGGINYFYGGPANAVSTADQVVHFANLASAINASQVTATIGGELGGFDSQDDFASILVTFLNSNGSSLGAYTLTGPNAATRGDVSTLLAESTTVLVPVGAVAADFLLTATREAGSDNDGDADNLFLVLNSGGLIVGPGQRVVISSGETLSGITVLSGGTLEVASGGTVVNTVVTNGGLEIVDAGGTDLSGTLQSGGSEDVFGSAFNTLLIKGGSMTVEAGGFTQAVVLDDAAVQSVSGLAIGTVISVSDSQTIGSGGLASNSVISGGSLIVTSGGNARGAVLVTGSETISAGGIDVGATLSGGTQDVFGRAEGALVKAGANQIVEAGGSTSATVLGGAASRFNAVQDFSIANGNPNGVWSYTASGALLTQPTPGSVFGQSGTNYWFNGQSQPQAVVIGQNTTGSTQTYASRVVPTDQLVLDPQGVADASVSFKAPTTGTYQISGDFTGLDTQEHAHPVEIRLNGTDVFSNTIASFGQTDAFNLTLSLNAGDILAFAVDTGPNGDFRDLSTGLNVTIATGLAAGSGGSQDVRSNGTASGTVVGNGGTEIVEAGGITSNTVIAGGLVDLQSGSRASGSILFTAAGGVLVVDSTTGPAAVISGLSRSATIDLRGITSASGDTVAFNSNAQTVTVTSGGVSEVLQVAGVAAGTAFRLGDDGAGGVLLHEVPPAPAGLGLISASDSGIVGDDITNVSTPTVSGTGEAGIAGGAGDTVTLLAGSTIVASATVQANGTWSATTSSLADGTYQLSAFETDAQGNASALSAPLAVTIDTVPPSTVADILTVLASAGATPLRIVAPSDGANPAGALSIKLTGLPSNGTVTLADGTTPVTAGESLSVAQLTGLDFTPASSATGTTSALTYTVADPAGNTASGAATIGVASATNPTSLYDFVFTYNDGKDYYLGAVADDGSHVQVGETLTTGLGTYTVFANAGVTALPVGTVSVSTYSHNGIGEGSPVPLKTAQGQPDGTAGLGSEADAVSGTDGLPHAFSPTQEASFTTTALYGFVFTYADNKEFYTGTVADDGSFGTTVGTRNITNGAGQLVGNYTVFAEGVTTRVSGSVTVDRFSAGDASLVPSAVSGSAGLGSESGTLTINGAATSFSPIAEPALSIAFQPVTPTAPPSQQTVIQNEVTVLYSEVLGRSPPDASGLATFSTAIANGMSLAAVRQTLANSPEAQNHLNQLYLQTFDRVADTGGLATYTQLLANGETMEAVQAILGTSAEAQTDINQLYLSVLARAADPGGLATYTGVLATGFADLDGVRSILAHSPEAISDLTSLFQSDIGRAPSAAELFGMEDQLGASTGNGASQTTIDAALKANGNAGGFTTITPPTGSASLTAAPNTPTLFAFDNIAFGQDTIAGFDPARDTLEISSALAANLATIKTDTTSANGNTIITLNPTQSITLNGVSPSNLSAANFIFK